MGVSGLDSISNRQKVSGDFPKFAGFVVFALTFSNCGSGSHFGEGPVTPLFHCVDLIVEGAGLFDELFNVGVCLGIGVEKIVRSRRLNGRSHLGLGR